MKFVWAISFAAIGAFAQDSVHTLAGRALQTGADNGPALQARFNDPAALACDASGNIYVADSQNHLIRRISAAGVTTIVTSGQPFNTPSGLAISAQGLIVSDTGNHVIRRINADGSTIMIAGSFGQSGFENGVGAAAHFDSPLGLAVSTNGTIYVADCGNHLIRAISPEGAVTTLAGSAGAWGSSDGARSSARFNGPIGLALDTTGNVFVSDSNNHTIRKITPSGEVSTWAGIGLQNGFVDGDRLAAKFFQPAELAFDPHGALCVADSMNHAIRKISRDGKVSTVAGFTAKAGVADGENQSAQFYNPYGLAFLPTGELIVADAYNQTIRNAVPPAELQLSFTRALTVQWNAIVGKTYQLQTATPALDGWLNFGAPITAAAHTAAIPLRTDSLIAIFRVVTAP